ncbi:hypothetical protein [Streptomyces zhihengii]|uniref:DNA primase n=1 Tax=Streptomyces zhihengii TaxID=1818004 RepID=A0ABS2UJI5_9ACTN|nr:hypothetical protein [Streptomyces zhihengii]MBM9617702.1 hypothetical protein [Streptomyces zhihengii]
MTKNAKIAVALVGGYLLGRTKKAKMAIGLGMFLAGKKLDLDPRRIGKLIAETPALGGLSDQVRKELVEATKSAATQALTQRATGLADSLAQRTKALDAPDDRRDEAEEPEEADRAEDVRDAEDAEDRGDDAGDGGGRTPARASAAKKRAASSGARRAPAKQARSGSDGARKASAPARKRTGSAASGAAKSASSRAGTAKKRTAPARKKSGDGNA